MNLREATVLIRLYEACQDQNLRRWAASQVPELDDVAQTQVIPIRSDETKCRYHLLAYREDSPAYPLGSKVVVCWPEELDTKCRDYAVSFDLASGVTVKWEAL